MNRRVIYDDKYFIRNHLRHVNSWYGVFVRLYYRYIASYCMAKPAGIHKGGRILDIGCGVGILVQQFNKLGYRAVGVDVSEAAIENSLRPDSCSLVKTTARLDYPDNHFDLVVSREVLEHIPANEIDGCIREWDRVGGGVMVHIIAVVERGASATNDPTHVNVQTEQWWVDKFKEHGYRVIKSPTKLFFSPFGGSGYFMMVKDSERSLCKS